MCSEFIKFFHFYNFNHKPDIAKNKSTIIPFLIHSAK